MKWTKEHDVLLGKEVMLFELWKYKLGSRERGNGLDQIAESLNQLQEPFFNVSQKSGFFEVLASYSKTNCLSLINPFL